MLQNPDGSLYSRYSVEEAIDARFGISDDYPYLSDILGSDWAVSVGWMGGSPKEYRAAASRMADKIYGSADY
jgi:hypothetical protein